MFTRGAEEEKLHTSSLFEPLFLFLPRPLGSSATSAQSPSKRGYLRRQPDPPAETNAIGHGLTFLSQTWLQLLFIRPSSAPT